MNKLFLAAPVILLIALSYSCKNNFDPSMATSKPSSLFTDDCKSPLVCQLSSAELRQRKTTVIAVLQKNMLEKRELTNGYAFKFDGNDAMIDTISSFIKSEKKCCNFFEFQLTVKGDEDIAWLQLTGPEGVKDFIKTEMEL